MAKARLRSLAAEADARSSLPLRAAEAIRARPWSGVAVALLAGVALGVGRRSWRGALMPLAVPLLGQLAAALLGPPYGSRPPFGSRAPYGSRAPTVARRVPRPRRTR